MMIKRRDRPTKMQKQNSSDKCDSVGFKGGGAQNKGSMVEVVTI